ncbi:hypothetical protein J4N46_03645 [Capnocytophaga sp. Marseille-Q4570]|jgi:hypothetical protein|uniref:Restriction endonuclease n=1 Tax=Capnocytophaga bilenii TaxID=2819369 RepID=A0ABS3PWD4_9FLAO|nr:hypothetical protein [Capnocytophaga bilenii]MBO1883542.1 hypothetical protein [Capnocytophaga bilenii]
MTFYNKTVKNHIEEFLKQEKNFFHNERDFQMHLASFLKDKNYYDNIFLEYSLPASILYLNTMDDSSKVETDIRIDIVVEKDGSFYPIELKYKTKLVEKNKGFLERFGKKIEGIEFLKNQAAQNIGRYSFWKDVERLEVVKKYFTPNIVAGFCIFMTNDQSYTNTPRGASKTFTMEEDIKHKGKLDWVGEVAESTKRRLSAIWLDNEYTIKKWDKVKNKDIEFYYTIVEV